jgi:hypothetical protein
MICGCNSYKPPDNDVTVYCRTHKITLKLFARLAGVRPSTIQKHKERMYAQNGWSKDRFEQSRKIEAALKIEDPIAKLKEMGCL